VKHNKRRPSALLPSLYLGSEWNAIDIELLIELNVSYVLNVAFPQVDNHFVKYVNHFRYFWITDFYDDGEADILQYFKSCWEYLDKALEREEVCLIHCKSGNSRAAALCIGYLMYHNNWSLAKAFSFAKSCRPTISLKEGFLKQLLKYQHVLEQQKEEERGLLEAERKKELQMDTKLKISEYMMGVRTREEVLAQPMQLDGDPMECEIKNKIESNSKEERKEENKRQDKKDILEVVSQIKRLTASLPSLSSLIVKSFRLHFIHICSLMFRADAWDEIKRLHDSLGDLVEFSHILRRSLFIVSKEKALLRAEHCKANFTRNLEGRIKGLEEWISEGEWKIRTTFGDKAESYLNAFYQSCPFLVGPFSSSIASFSYRCLVLFSKRTNEERMDCSEEQTESVGAFFSRIMNLLKFVNKKRDVNEFQSKYFYLVSSGLINNPPPEFLSLQLTFACYLDINSFQFVDECYQSLNKDVKSMASKQESEKRFTFYLATEFKEFAINLRNLLKDYELAHKSRGQFVKGDKKSKLTVTVISSRIWSMEFLLGGPPDWSPDHNGSFQPSVYRGLNRDKWVGGCVLPASMMQAWEQWQQAYRFHHPSNVVKFVPHLGKAELLYTLNGEKYNIIVSTIQMCILTLFNGFEELTYKDIQTASRIGDRDLKRALFSICYAPFSRAHRSSPLLLVNSNPASGDKKKKISDKDSFVINQNFKSAKRKFSVPDINPIH